MALLAVVIAGSVMRRASQIAFVTLLAFFIYRAGRYAFGVLVKPAAVAEGALTAGERATALIRQGWCDLSVMSAVTAISYFLAFAAVIWIVFFIRSMFTVTLPWRAQAGPAHGAATLH